MCLRGTTSRERNGEGGGETENSGGARKLSRGVSRFHFVDVFSLVLSSPANILFLSVCLLGHRSHIHMHMTHTREWNREKEEAAPFLSFRLPDFARYKYRLKIGNVADKLALAFLAGKSQTLFSLFLSLSCEAGSGKCD